MAQLIYPHCPKPILMSQTKIPRVFHNNTLLLNNHKKWSIHALDFSTSSLKHSYFVDGFGVEVAKTKVVNILRQVLRDNQIGESLEYLDLIDATQRLGIDYHFHEEIEIFLRRLYVLSNAQILDPHNNLHKASLLFRLLRQQGYHMSTDVFKVFLDNKGNFNEELRKDIKGLSSLYEASQVCMHGDDNVLVEAENFSRHGLNIWLQTHLDHHLANFVHNTLAHPHHKSVAKFMVGAYFGDTQWTNKWIYVLQDVARMDFNATQKLHQDEILQFLKWWKQTNLAKELKFARDQPTKWYLCSLVCLTDSCYSQQRLQLAKSISFVYLIDDLFDVFGSFNDLTFFTEAVSRWDLGAAKGLPNCMAICFQSLFEVTNEISNKIYKKHGWNPIGLLSKAWAKLCKAFLVEAEWMRSEHSPRAEEYLRNGIVSTGIHVILIHVFFLLEHKISKQTVEMLDDDLDIISSSAMILRLWDDMGSAKDENQEGHDGSYLKYYMNEHPSISYEATEHHIMERISHAWKTLNREYLLSNTFSTRFTQASLNVARAVPLAYNYGRNQSLVTLEKLMEQLLFYGV
ncbi:(3S,6E)-nerolidol synthase 1-like [Benincasa hispida]|uniref:(3S,6E)-nerolidol synthase 1-like n=1 Tax=Benincasa hispida TaxID=102211 RepID=UPI00190060D5|nr:(3S,6E)-nerolidol synthase 1-like [Benincasa hispida]